MRFEKNVFGVGENMQRLPRIFSSRASVETHSGLISPDSPSVLQFGRWLTLFSVNGPHVADSDDTEFYLIHKSVLSDNLRKNYLP